MKLILLTILLCSQFNISFASGPKTLTIGTQNLWHYPWDYKNRLENLESEFYHYYPDILGVQEAWTWFENTGLYNKILKMGDYQNYFYKTNGPLVFVEGMAIMTRSPLMNQYALSLPYDQKLARRMLVGSETFVHGKIFHILNVHFTPSPDKKYRREAQLQFLIKHIHSIPQDRIIVLMGDFNQEHENSFYDSLLKIGFKSSLPFDVCTHCSDNQYSSGSEDRNLDYIFYQDKHLKLIKSELMFDQKPISDHYGILANFEII